MKKPDPHAALRPAAQGFWAVFDAIQNSSFEHLLELEDVVQSLTTTNCWFAIYDAAKYMAPLIAEEKKRRVFSAMCATHGWQP